MTTTPVEIRHLRPARALFGYKREEIDEALEGIAQSFEVVWRERAELADEVEGLELEVARLRESEELLKNTLVAAERVAAETRERACREGELIVAEAHAEARSVTRAAQAECERLLAEAARVRALLEGALGLARDAQDTDVEEHGEPEAPAAAPQEYPAGWPRLEDTADVKPFPRDGSAQRRTA